jgi:hypothetical protein
VFPHRGPRQDCDSKPSALSGGQLGQPIVLVQQEHLVCISPTERVTAIILPAMHQRMHQIRRPNLNRAAKFAFLVSAGFPGTVESGARPGVEGSATFPTGWFSTRERSYQWLAET